MRAVSLRRPPSLALAAHALWALSACTPAPACGPSIVPDAATSPPDSGAIDAHVTPLDAAPPIDVGSDAGSDAGTDASLEAPDAFSAPDAALGPFCSTVAPNCAWPPGAPPGCCAGTVCDDPTSPTPRCCVEHEHPCNIDSDCCLATDRCDATRHCTPQPACAPDGDACGDSAPWITGCCDALAICDTRAIPSTCCHDAGTACTSDADCCLTLSCGADGLCHVPSCAPSNDRVLCARYPTIACCDRRLSCMSPSLMNPNVRCCAPAGTVLDATSDPNLCCGNGVMFFADGSFECLDV